MMITRYFQKKSVKTCLLASLFFAATSAASFAQTLIEKADKQYELHAYKAAAQSYEQLLQRETIENGVLSKLADCYLQMNQIGKAADAYNRAHRAGQAQADDYLANGRVLMMLGRYAEAEVQFDLLKKTNSSAAEHFKKAIRFAKENDENTADMQVSAVAKVNTAGSDYGVAIWKDQIIWSSTRNDLQRERATNAKNWDGSAPNQLFAAPIENVSSQPFKTRFLKSDLKNIMNESQPSFSADGKMVAYAKNNFVDGNRISSKGGLEMSVYTATVDEDGNWMDVKAFPFNGFGYSTGFPCLSPDGSTLYFASNRPNGQGGFDIYQSKKRGNSWGEPVNLGSNVNTAGDEITPFTDGKTLYFASDWQIGYGGFDIFRVSGVSSQVENMGAVVNSASDDFGFVYAPSVSVGFFSSNRVGGKGKEDIYRVDSRSERVNIVIVEKGSSKPIADAKVIVKQGNAENLSALKSGNFLANLGDGKTLTIEVKKEGFKTETVKIEPNYVEKSRIVEVGLVRDVPTQMSTVVLPEYTGIVSDAMTGVPMEGVLVKLTNQQTNAQMEATTDAKGRYKFALSQNQTPQYLLTFSKEDFQVGQKLFKLNELKTKYLGETELTPAATTGRNPAKVEEKKDDRKEVKGIPKPLPNSPKNPKEVPRDYDIVTQPTLIPTAQATYTGAPRYTVQLLSSSMDAVVNLSTFANLKTVGNVYSVVETGTQKIRLGIFEKRDDANTAQKKAVDLGYKGSFVMEEKNANAVANYLFTPPVLVKVVEIPKEYNPPVPPKKVVTIVDDKTFKVRIAAMKKPEWFDDSKVSKFWKIERWAEGDLTLFVMDGFKTLEEAKTMKKKVQANGYVDAKVVVRDGANLKVVD